MRKKLFFAATFIAIAALLVGCGSESDTPTGPSIVNGTVTPVADAFATAMNGGINTAYYNVYTPPGYSDTGDPYPVLYMLHGFGGDENTFYNMMSITDAADLLIAEGEIDPLVIVMPNGKNAFAGSFYTDGAHPAVGDAETHIFNVIAEVEANYNVATDASGKGIGGHSMGGYGTISLALNNPGTFGSASIYAGPLSFWGSKTADPTDETYKGLEEILPVVLLETGYGAFLPGGDLAAYQAMSPTDGTVTAMMFAAAAAFSPYDGTYDATAHAATGVNLPIGLDGQIDLTTWARWMAFDPMARLATQAANIAPTSVALSLDVGAEDDLGFNGAHQYFAGAYELAFTVAPASVTIHAGVSNSLGGTIAPDHRTHTFERLKLMLKFHDDQF